MRFHAILTASFLAVSPLWSAPAPKAAPGGLETEDQKILYMVGIILGQRTAGLDLTPAEFNSVALGFKDVALGQKLKVAPGEYGPKVNTWAAARQAAKEEKNKAVAAARMKKEKPFLEKAAKEKGAKAFPSGLIYTELKPGTGGSPSPSDTVKAAYVGALSDGKVFDSSSAHGGPVEFSIAPGAVVPCWSEGIPKMKVGGKAKLVCPAEIGYQSQEKPGIPPGSTLVFEVELVEIVKN